MARQRILTIEDDAAIRRGIVDALRFAGYGVLESGRGDEGAQLAVAAEYDLLLLDLVLPGATDWRFSVRCGVFDRRCRSSSSRREGKSPIGSAAFATAPTTTWSSRSA